jgi:hypothetical protein
MAPAEVRGVEVKQYIGEQLTTLVPRVVGQTADAEQKKRSGGASGPRRTDWSWESYERELGIPAARLEIARTLVDRVRDALTTRGLELEVVYRKGYVAFRRTSGYIVLLVDAFWRKVPRLAAKVPGPPQELDLTNPYPALVEDWDERQKGVGVDGAFTRCRP